MKVLECAVAHRNDAVEECGRISPEEVKGVLIASHLYRKPLLSILSDIPH
jgi:hypothetical protein